MTWIEQLVHESAFTDESYQYLIGRGVTDSEISQWELGFANDKISQQYPNITGKVLTPVRDGFGRLPFLMARSLNGGSKYITFPTGARKRWHLYGLEYAKQSIIERNEAILVEGQFDCILLHKIKYKNTIALMGTPTTEQMLLLLCYTNRALIVLDSDSGGDSFGRRVVKIGENIGMCISTVRCPQGKYKDPDEWARADPESLHRAIIDQEKL